MTQHQNLVMSYPVRANSNRPCKYYGNHGYLMEYLKQSGVFMWRFTQTPINGTPYPIAMEKPNRATR